MLLCKYISQIMILKIKYIMKDFINREEGFRREQKQLNIK